MSSRGASQERILTSQERETPFAGYGDRVGSGVAFAPAQWRGGEIVTDPNVVNDYIAKGPKPRRFFYSPIGDGVVAADGIELKRLPPDLTPKVEVIQQRVVERGDRGRSGLRVTEKTWSTGGPQDDSRNAYGHTDGGGGPPAAGVGAGARAPQPPADFSNLASQLGPPAGNRPASVQSAPAARNGYGGPAQAKGPGDGGPAGPGGPPYASTRSTPMDMGRMKGSPTSNGLGPADFPQSGRSSANLYEPGMRYEINKEYLVSNPRELIHQYATTTPVTTIDPSLETTRTITRQHYTQTVEESFGPFPPYTSGPNVPKPLSFVRQLRDETMTESQRQANRQQQPMSASAKDQQFEQRIEEIRRSTNRQISPNDPVVEQLTGRLGGMKH